MKLLYGVGYNTKEFYKSTINKVKQPNYQRWQSMLMRCYDERVHLRQPRYVECSVSQEWHNFQNFAAWDEKFYPSDGKIYQLDKDLKIHNNKIYSPETCLYVRSDINLFLTDSKRNRGVHPIGVCWHKRKQKFMAYCKDHDVGKDIFLGYYSDPIEAHMAWRLKKYELCIKIADTVQSDDVRNALIQWGEMLMDNKIHPIEQFVTTNL